MSAKQHFTSTLVTRSQAKQQTLTDTCVCTHTQPNSIMDPGQKQELQALLNDLVLSLKQDLATESQTQRISLDSLKTYMETKMEGTKQPAKTDLKPDLFAGNFSEDASDWLDLFERISKINSWPCELQLEAFPIYLTGITRAWYLTLADDQKTNWDNLKQVFQDRFTPGPQIGSCHSSYLRVNSYPQSHLISTLLTSHVYVNV